MRDKDPFTERILAPRVSGRTLRVAIGVRRKGYRRSDRGRGRGGRGLERARQVCGLTHRSRPAGDRRDGPGADHDRRYPDVHKVPLACVPTRVNYPLTPTSINFGVTAGDVDLAVNDLLLAAFAPVNLVLGVPLLVASSLLAPFLGQGAANLVMVPVSELVLGLLGPGFSGAGANGVAVQEIIDAVAAGDPSSILNAVITAPALVADGVLNGGFGPNLGGDSFFSPPAFTAGEPLIRQPIFSRRRSFRVRLPRRLR